MSSRAETARFKVAFHRRTCVGAELSLMAECLREGTHEAFYQNACAELLKAELGAAHAQLTTSCTHALELAALALSIGPGDEVIVPSFTFTSTANAFLLRGASMVFADIDRATLNLDPESLARKIGPKTRVVLAMHYAGIACDMDRITALAREAGAAVVEDAAHALFGRYKGRHLGTIGAIGTFSFHHTKNFSSGEGGAFLCQGDQLAEAAEVIREKGTNRSQFMRGLIHKYEWIREGSSYVIADVLAAQLLAQLQERHAIQAKRERVWRRYHDGLRGWADQEGVRQPYVPEGCDPAWHLYWLVLPSVEARDHLLAHLRSDGIGAAFHYVPLHAAPMGRRLGGQPGDAPVTEWAAERLIRLPFYTDLSEAEQSRVIERVRSFRC